MFVHLYVDLYLNQSRSLFENIKKSVKTHNTNYGASFKRHRPFSLLVVGFILLSISYSNFLVQHQAGLSDPGNISSVFLYYLEWITSSKCSVSPLCTSKTQKMRLNNLKGGLMSLLEHFTC